MSGALGTLYLAALTGLVFVILGAAVAKMAYPRLRARLGRIEPAARFRWLLAFAAAPLGSAAALTLLCFLPSILGLAGLATDHCLGHDDHHLHLCLVHRPASPGGVVGPGLLALALAGLVAGLAPPAQAWWRARRLIGSLRSASVEGPAADVRILQAQAPVAFCAGILRPGVYVSSGLLQAATADVLAVVLEHERAHARRRDGLWKFAAALLLATHLPGIRTRLLADLARACEEACDAEAALRLGDRLRVAEAIISVERVLAAAPPFSSYASAFGGSNVVARVEALLDPATERPRIGRRWVVACAAALVVASDPLHHLIETLLGHLHG